MQVYSLFGLQEPWRFTAIEPLRNRYFDWEMLWNKSERRDVKWVDSVMSWWGWKFEKFDSTNISDD